MISRKHGWWSAFALLVAALALLAAGCGGDDEGSSGTGSNTEASGGGAGVEALPSSSCTAVEYKGEGDPDVLLASDFPLQGSSRTQTIQIVEAIRYLLEKSNYKAGDHNVAYQSCDDATAQAGKWDSGKCSTNAQAYAANEKVVARHRHLQLGVRGDRDPGPEPGSGRRRGDDLAGQHVRLPDRGRPGL